jgi:hypothetical protein
VYTTPTAMGQAHSAGPAGPTISTTVDINSELDNLVFSACAEAERHTRTAQELEQQLEAFQAHWKSSIERDPKHFAGMSELQLATVRQRDESVRLGRLHELKRDIGEARATAEVWARKAEAARDGTLYVSAQDQRDPRWLHANRELYQAAVKAGRVKYEPQSDTI